MGAGERRIRLRRDDHPGLWVYGIVDGRVACTAWCREMHATVVGGRKSAGRWVGWWSIWGGVASGDGWPSLVVGFDAYSRMIEFATHKRWVWHIDLPIHLT